VIEAVASGAGLDEAGREALEAAEHGDEIEPAARVDNLGGDAI